MTKQKLEWIREGVGDRFDDIEIQMRGYAADQRRRPRRRVDDRWRDGSRPDDALSSAMFLIGTVDEVCDMLQQRREEWGVSYNVFGETDVEAFAPVVSRLVGT